jgi:hypothetical protein
MTLLPRHKPGNMERAKWSNVPHGLEGRIVSILELKNIFPIDDKYGEIEIIQEEPKYSVYGRRAKPSQYAIPLAYQCKSCNNIVMGPPRIKDDTSIRLNIPLTGREGYDLYCRVCNTHLKDFTWKVS